MGFLFNRDKYQTPIKEYVYCEDEYNKPDKEVKRMIASFEEKKQREVIEVYEDSYNWLLYTRPFDRSLNFSPYYKVNKMTGDISFISVMESRSNAWGMLENKVYVKPGKGAGSRPYELDFQALNLIAEYYDEIIALCDTAFEIENYDTVRCENSREELGIKYFGYIVKGSIKRNDELEIINCDGRLLGKVNAAHVDIRPEGNKAMDPDETATWIYILENLNGYYLPVFLIKPYEEKRQEFNELLNRIQADSENYL